MRCGILLHLEWEDEIITVTAQLSNRWGQLDLVSVYRNNLHLYSEQSCTWV